MRSACVAILVCVLAGCGDDVPADVACRDRDGFWECRDDERQEGCRCAERLPDAGERCVDSGVCEGLCIYQTGGCNTHDARGVCQGHRTRYECYQELYEGEPFPFPGDPPLRACREVCPP